MQLVDELSVPLSHTFASVAVHKKCTAQLTQQRFSPCGCCSIDPNKPEGVIQGSEVLRYGSMAVVKAWRELSETKNWTFLRKSMSGGCACLFLQHDCQLMDWAAAAAAHMGDHSKARQQQQQQQKEHAWRSCLKRNMTISATDSIMFNTALVFGKHEYDKFNALSAQILDFAMFAQ